MLRLRLLAAAVLFSLAATAAEAPKQKTPAGKTRVYYIAADEVEWDYTPRGRDLIGAPTTEGAEVEASPAAYGKHRVFRKAIFREYTDATFTKLKPRPPQWEHLGILGPLLRAEVGDTLEVHFKNNTKILASMHPHGLSYAKDSEGARYNDGTEESAKRDDIVHTGESYVYKWTVPERAGPAPGERDTVLWMYHSHIVEPKDLNTGLLGPILISARGTTRPDGTPRSVDREFIAAFAVFDETLSWYFDTAILKNGRRTFNLKLSDPVLREQMTLYSINGLIEGNLPGLTMKKGQRVRWYLMSSSNEDDVHSAHWHGQTALVHGMRTDLVPLLPMSMAVADMVPDREGTWLFHCHVNDHLHGGMQALFTVKP